MKIPEIYRANVEWFSRPGAGLGGDDSGDCYYIVPWSDDQRCGVGVCMTSIPDEIVSHYGTKGIGEVWDNYDEVSDLFEHDEQTLEFLQAMQIAHDHAGDVEEYLACLDKLYLTWAIDHANDVGMLFELRRDPELSVINGRHRVLAENTQQ